LSAFLDTNVLIRHLTGDPPEQARQATAFLAQADELLVADLIVAEVVFVLESFYEVARERVAEPYLSLGPGQQWSSSQDLAGSDER
jgi:predicted nucleic acid-binding protein